MNPPRQFLGKADFGPFEPGGESRHSPRLAWLLPVFEKLFIAASKRGETMSVGDQKTITPLCPGGNQHMRRLVEPFRRPTLNLTPLLTHIFSLDQRTEAYKHVGERRDESRHHGIIGLNDKSSAVSYQTNSAASISSTVSRSPKLLGLG